MEGHKEQIPRQDLPDEGSAVPSELSPPEGSDARRHQQQNPMAETAPRKSRSKGRVAESQDPLNQWKALRRRVMQVICDEGIRPEQRLPLLRLEPLAKALELRDNELNRIIADAQAEKDGRATIIEPGVPLDTTPTKWLWENLLIKEGLNLVYAEPKCGKTRFLLSGLGAMVNGKDSCLGYSLSPTKPTIFIGGPDMHVSMWASFLKDYGMLDEQGAIKPQICGLCCAGNNFRLNAKGIEDVTDKAREYEGLIILLDAYATCISGLGYDENKADAATPLMQLQDAVAPFKATIICIHHAKKGSVVDGVSGTSRGSSALPAVVDQIVQLCPVRNVGETTESGEIQIQTKGRASKPLTLLVKQSQDGRSWESLGTPEERAGAAWYRKQGERLSPSQRQVMERLMTQYEIDKGGLTATEICRSLGRDPKTQIKHVREYLRGLIETKGFVKKSELGKKGTGKPQIVYLPSSDGRSWWAEEQYPDA